MIIKSSENLSLHYHEISDLAHETGQPIYITRQGEGDLVLLSMEAYEAMVSQQAMETTVITKKENFNMSEFKLGSILKEMYATAPRGQQVANIHLFGIYYADVIEKERLNKKEILRAAMLPESYQTEISKGIGLAPFVEVKPQQKSRIQALETKLNILSPNDTSC